MAEELEQYLCQRYGILKIGNLTRKRLEEAYNSSLQVKPDRLLQCWRSMEQYLNNARLKAVASGKRMTGDDLLRYDLTIVLSKYDRFIRSVIAAERENILAKDGQEMYQMYKNVSKNRKKQEPKRTVRDISALYDEIP